MKKIFIKVIALFSVLLLVLAAFVGCKGSNDEPIDSGDDSNVSTDPVGTDENKKDKNDYIALTENGAPKYTLVYQSSDIIDGASAADNAKIANSMSSRMKKALATADFRVVSDKRMTAGSNVITVGSISGITDEYFADMRFGDYKIREGEGHISLVGYVYSALYIASEHFSDALEVIDGELYVSKSIIGESYTGHYQIDKLTLGGATLADYEISYGSGDEARARQLAAKIRDVSGHVLPIVENGTAAKSINIKKLSSVGGYNVSIDGSRLEISYCDAVNWELAWMYIDGTLSKIVDKGEYDLAAMAAEQAASVSRRMMTFNVLNVWSKGSTPGNRDNVTADTVLKYAPDFVCLQEFDVLYRNASGGFISLVSDKYAEVEINGVDKNNVWNPIFYDKTKYKVVESGMIYFPDHCNSVESGNYPGGTSDGNAKFRSFVWAVLEDKTDGSKYVIGNLHFSVQDVNVTQPQESALVISKLKEVAAKYENCITLVGGDYNSRRTQSGAGVANMLNNGFKDTFDKASSRTDLGTTHEGTNGPTAQGYMTSAIDHILTLNDLSVSAYLILTDADILAVSDHCATVIQFSAKGQ